MDGRRRVQDFLARGVADRPPFLVMATEVSAKMAQCSVDEMMADPNLFVRSFQESSAVLGLDALAVEIPPAWAVPVARGEEPSSHPPLAALREDLHRLRATALDRLAMVVLLPGPATLCDLLDEAPTIDAMDDVVAGLLRLPQYLDTPGLDAIGLLERRSLVGVDMGDLAEALAALWNVARYYSLPSLLVAAEGGTDLATVGSTAVAVWSGSGARELLAAGAPVAGVPISDPHRLPALPRRAFYMTEGEIPPAWEVADVRDLVRRAVEGPEPV